MSACLQPNSQKIMLRYNAKSTRIWAEKLTPAPESALQPALTNMS